eukprot:CAMPEP_0170486568 /NCGR_PEP_ID=MMETSP0208-20121228/5541_1 /TAXON_ID=197538 /ORGANISM="Strombidium inclinatum, Strain S3" /LENGTH=141 /DNA_ID=CAMNT_0010760541 /DNA_START=2021 /DNA_END=2446 /DNA_ORIENTATION=+
MTEPIFHLTEKKDSLDIMLEMNMEDLLKHPVIVEVLDLTYEGKYSADDSPLNLSYTLWSFFELVTFDSKSITERMWHHIKSVNSIGTQSGMKQSTLQFNIWKQSISRRQNDEKILTILFSIFLFYSLLDFSANLSNITRNL